MKGDVRTPPKKPEFILLGDKAEPARESDVLGQTRYDRLFVTSELMSR